MATLNYLDENGNPVALDMSADGAVWIGPEAPTDPAYSMWIDTDDFSDVAPPSNRNRIINGDFSVNQRGFTSGGGGGTWSADRWRCWSVDGTTTQYVVAATPGELPESARQYMRLVTSGQSAALCSMLLRQTIEDVRTLSGKTVTVSFWAKAASGTPKVGVALTQVFGSGGSGDVPSPNNVSVTLSTTWTRYSVTIALPAVTGKAIDTHSYVCLDLWTSAGTTYANLTNIGVQNTDVSIWGVQVEEGLVATAYEQKTYAEELRACQRYYRKYSVLTGFVCNASNVLRILPAEWVGNIGTSGGMRKAPPLVTVGTIAYAYNGTVIDTNPACNPGNAEVYVAGAAAIGGAWIRWNNVVFDAEL